MQREMKWIEKEQTEKRLKFFERLRLKKSNDDYWRVANEFINLYIFCEQSHHS